MFSKQKISTAHALMVSSALAAKCPFGYGGDDAPKHKHPKVGVANITYPNEYFTCSGTAPTKTTSLTT